MSPPNRLNPVHDDRTKRHEREQRGGASDNLGNEWSHAADAHRHRSASTIFPVASSRDDFATFSWQTDIGTYR